MSYYQSEKIREILKRAGHSSGFITAFFKKAGRLKSGHLKKAFHQSHHEVFQEIHCLDCGNCCKTIPPRLLPGDIEKLSRAVRLTSSRFLEKYCTADEEEDHIFRHMPCPFLGSDNYCSVYESRPKACREYPHTGSNRISKLQRLTRENASICPAVFLMIERIHRDAGNQP